MCIMMLILSYDLFFFASLSQWSFLRSGLMDLRLLKRKRMLILKRMHLCLPVSQIGSETKCSAFREVAEFSESGS